MGLWGTLWIQTTACSLRVAAGITQHGAASVEYPLVFSATPSPEWCMPDTTGLSEATPGSAASTVSTDLMHSTDCVALGCSLLVGKDLARMDLPKGWRHLLPAPYNQTLVLGEPCLRCKDSGLPVQHVKMMDRSEEEQVTLLRQAGFPMPAQSYRG